MTRALLVGASLALVWGGGAVAQTAEELDALRERVSQSRERVAEHEAAERNVFDRLEAIDRRQAELETAVRGVQAQVRSARTALAAVEADAARLESQLERTQSAMSRRAVALYKTGGVGPLRVLFAASSLRELLQRTAALQQMLGHDADLVARFRAERLAYDAAREETARTAQRHRELLGTLRSERASLDGERASKQALLEQVREDRRGERELLIELEAAARALEAALSELGGSARSHAEWLDGSGFGARRGKLPLPVAAPVVATFGRVVDADFLTQTRRNGVELGARHGDAVRAVARGAVRFAGWFRGYGKIVILDHGDQYFTISGHLSEVRVAVGDRVSEGEIVGLAGETGSLAGPRLYFEVRRGSEALDPVDWLSAERLAEAR